MRSSSLSQLYFESARLSQAPFLWIGCSIAVHLGLVFLPLDHLLPSRQNITFAKGDAGLEVELMVGEAPVPEQEFVQLAPAEHPVEGAASAPVILFPEPDEFAFAEPAPVQKTVKPAARRAAVRAPRTPREGAPRRAGSAAAQPAAQLLTTQPPYPPGARELGVEGTVRLRVRVGTDGCPRAVEIARSSGRADFDGTSLDTVKRDWRFRAARGASGTPVESTVSVTIRFELNS